MTVGAFHGHAHNCKCQLVWHSMYILGTGHSEGEGCEHIFSALNKLAHSTRHASPFHCPAIEKHFTFWDADKYAVLSTKQISVLAAELAIIQSELGLTNTNFPHFLQEEHNYLDDHLSVRYIEVLNELAEQWANWDLACEAANNSLVVDSLYAKLQHAEALVASIETLLAEYNHFKEEVSLANYCSALDDLEHLVIMRLFELSKLSLSGIGYKLHQQLGKVLQR
ncbi:hypothetical protein BDR06DRAFT_984575 [Suillus hirtellus]|nr:hypothetical protein BDR06DRAFT_984575 [Suillus hirtellus]